ncbi:hypothetical protein D9M71_819200 [compost metagenome]
MQYIFIDAIEQVAGQGDVQFLGLAQVFSNVDVHQRPCAPLVLWIGCMQSHFISGRNWRAVFGQNLEMTFNGFTGHGHRVIQIFPGGKAPRNVGYFHAPGVLVVAH